LHDLPVLKMRAVPALTIVPGEGQSGLTELIWTMREQFARLQDCVGAAQAGSKFNKTSDDRPPPPGLNRAVQREDRLASFRETPVSSPV
jgi:hypothetical protein